MPLNVPALSETDISIGPAVAFLGAAGTTPTDSFGGLGEDGIQVSFSTDTVDVMQGNPRVASARFIASQTMSITLSSNEWNFDRLRFALGGGTVTDIPASKTYDYSANPCPIEAALHLRHSMCKSGNTMNIYAWRVAGDGSADVSFAADTVHEFSYNFQVLLAQTDWAGVAIDQATGPALARFFREIT